MNHVVDPEKDSYYAAVTTFLPFLGYKATL